jgi:hypothetical protein
MDCAHGRIQALAGEAVSLKPGFFRTNSPCPQSMSTSIVPVDSVIVIKNKVAVDSEIINETASRAYA